MSQSRPEPLMLDPWVVMRAPPSESPDSSAPASLAPLTRRPRGSEPHRHPPSLPHTGEPRSSGGDRRPNREAQNQQEAIQSSRAIGEILDRQARVAGFGNDVVFSPAAPEEVVSVELNGYSVRGGEGGRDGDGVRDGPVKGEMEDKGVPRAVEDVAADVSSGGGGGYGKAEEMQAALEQGQRWPPLPALHGEAPLRPSGETEQSARVVGVRADAAVVNHDTWLSTDGTGDGRSMCTGSEGDAGRGTPGWSSAGTLSTHQSPASAEGVATAAGGFSIGGSGSWWPGERGGGRVEGGVTDEGSSLMTDWSPSERTPRVSERQPEVYPGELPMIAPAVSVRGSASAVQDANEEERFPVPDKGRQHVTGENSKQRPLADKVQQGEASVPADAGAEGGGATTLPTERRSQSFRASRSTTDLENYQPPSLLRQVSKYMNEDFTEAKRLQSLRSRARHKRLTFADDHGDQLQDTKFFQALYYSKEGVPPPRRNAICCSIS